MSGQIDEEEFEDFMSRVNLIDEAVKGLKDGTVSVEDVDNKYAKEIEAPKKPTTKMKAQAEFDEKKAKEDERRKALAKLPKSVEEAERKLAQAKETKDPNKVKKAEEDMYRLKRQEQKAKEYEEWRLDRKDELRDQYRGRQQRRERWDLWAAANPKAAKLNNPKARTTNYEAWDNWEPEDEWDDLKDDLMPENKPELAAMEEDCNRRAKHRRERIREAENLKEEGNAAFKAKRYQNAGELYGAALAAAPWITACLTNRAMCHIHMKNFKNAVRDCKDALSVADWNNEKEGDPVPLKALMRKGQAYAGQGKWEKAAADLEKCVAIAPDNKGCLKAQAEVLAQWEEAKREQAVASRASELMAESSLLDIDDDELEGELEGEAPTPAREEAPKPPAGDAPVNDLVAVQEQLQALAGADEATGKAALGRLQWLLVSDDDNRIHFRSQEGFGVVLPWLEREPQEALGVVTNACLNEKNVAVLREAGPASHRHQPIKDILALMEHAAKPVQYAAALCIAVCSESGERSRTVLIDCAAGKALCARLAHIGATDATAPHALRAMKTLAGDVPFRGSLREEAAPVLPVLAAFLASPNSAVLEDAGGALALLCNDPALRRQATVAVLQPCMSLLAQEQRACPAHVMMNILGAVLNACVDEAPREAVATIPGALNTLAKLITPGEAPTAVRARTAAIVARVAQAKSGANAEAFREAGALKHLLEAAMGEVGLKKAKGSKKVVLQADSDKDLEECQIAAVRALAAIATKDKGSIPLIAKSRLFGALPGLIATLDSSAVGNACMIVSQCAAVEGTLQVLAGTVEPLVKVMHTAANENKKSVAKNAAIALAKLAKDPANLEKIRELHGIEIMFAYIKV